MNLKLPLVLSMLLSFIGITTTKAQSTATFGTATTSSATYGPFYRASATSTANTSNKILLFTETELIAAGIYPGSVITDIAWYKVSTATLSNGATATATLYMRDSVGTMSYPDAEPVLNYINNGFTQVTTRNFDATTNNIAGNTWVGFNGFSYTYDGGNLEVYVNWELTPGTGSASTASFTFRYTSTTPDNRLMYSHVSPTSSSNFTEVVQRPNTQMTFTPPAACAGSPNPGIIVGQATFCGGGSTALAVAGQATGSGITYQWESSPAGANTWTPLAGATNPNYVISFASLPVDYRVLVTCTNGGLSNYTPVFATNPTTENLPYYETFTSYPPPCWTEADGILTPNTVLTGTTSSWVQDGWMNNGTTGAFRNQFSAASDNEWAISPSINLGSSGNTQLIFDLAVVDGSTPAALGTDDTIAVVISTDNGQTWPIANTVYVHTATTPAMSAGYNHVIVPLTGYTGLVKIGFYASEGTVNDPNIVDGIIDNVLVQVTPSCQQPYMTQVNSITGPVVTTSWMQSPSNPTIGYSWRVTQAGTGYNGIPAAMGAELAGDTSATILGLMGGTSYTFYVRALCGLTDSSALDSVNFALPPSNDSAVNATMLIPGVSVCNGSNSNGVLAGGTAEPNEPTISCQGAAGNFNSVWYKFIAPPSGQVRISTDHTVAASDSLDDTKMALYQVTDSSDYSTFQILYCDDDNGVVADGYRSLIYAVGLTPLTTYYVKVDKWNASAVSGSFCIDVIPMDSAMLSGGGNCGGAAFDNNDWYTGGAAWVNVVDSIGELIANVRTNTSSSIGAVTSRLYDHNGPIRTFMGKPYLDRNYELNAATQPSVPIDLQFFFTDGEYSELQAADPSATMGNLGVTRLPTAACAMVFDTTGQTTSFLPQTANGGNSGIRYIQVTTPGLSSFFIHAGPHPLTIKLQDITAVNMGASNKVNWSTLSEEKSDMFILERSANGIEYSPLATIAARGVASAYEYFDMEPLTGINYYRLKMVEGSGAFAYSKVVTVTTTGKAFGVAVYPNPATDQLTVQVHGVIAEDASVTVTDLTGKHIRTLNINGNKAEVDLRNLSNGVYLIRYSDTHHTETVKFTKQ